MRPIASGLNRIVRASFLLGVIAWLGPLVLYIATMRRCVDFWDTGEMQTVPWILGIAHPTGFPSFVLGGYIFSHLVPIGSVAFRLTLFSALAMSLTAGLVFAAARELRIAAPIACAAAWLFAVTQLVWSRGTRTEVHALAIFAVAILLTLSLRFLRLRDKRILPWIGLAAGLGLGVHPVVLFAIIPTAVIVGAAIYSTSPCLGHQHARLPKVGLRTFAQTAGTFAAGFAVYLYLPLRSAWVYAHRLDPTLALGLPVGRPYWDYGHPSTLANFMREVSGSDFAVSASLAAIFHPESYLRIPQAFYAPAVADFGLTATVISLIGAVALRHRIPLVATAGLLGGALLAVVFAVSYPAESDVARYFLIAFWILALLVATGLQGVVDLIVHADRHFFRDLKNAISARVALGDLVRHRHVIEYVAAALLFFSVADRVRDHGDQFWRQPLDLGAAPFIDRILATTPDNAIIVANWLYATPLAYAAYVENRMGNRIVETAWPAEDSKYIPGWFATRPVIIVDPGATFPASVKSAQTLDGGSPSMFRIDAVMAK